jgi:hypothetical protein
LLNVILNDASPLVAVYVEGLKVEDGTVIETPVISPVPRAE